MKQSPEFSVKLSEELLKKLIEMDEGAAYLGECALVPYKSPINETGILFYNTLYDENASCHLALGRPYPENIRGGEEMSPEELKEKGGNASLQHEDFMFGTADMSVDGIMHDGTVIPVFRNGSFVID
jgi:aminopeptidase